MADNELTVTSGNNFAANGTNAVSHFFDTTTMDGKMALYNAMQTADKVDERLNEPLHVTNVLAQAIEVTNQETGEINPSTRVVIHAEEVPNTPCFIVALDITGLPAAILSLKNILSL